MKYQVFPVAVLCASLFASSSVSAQLIYSEDFDTDVTANWNVNASPGSHNADFFFDYSTVGIPSAPNSGGSTRGLKLQANTTGSTFGGLSVSPMNLSAGDNFILQFDMWLNYNGPLNGGGSGSTQITGAGVGTAGDSAQWPGGTTDSIWFAATGDGGSSVDYRVYSSNGLEGDGSTAYAAAGAGNRNASHPYYAQFGGNTAPNDQISLYPGQTGQTGDGTQAFAWRDVRITRSGDIVTWSIDGLVIATMDASAVTLSGDNILFMHSDINASSSSDPLADDLLFGLIDNVVVTVPEPSTYALFGLGALVLLFRRRLAPGRH